MSTDNHLLRIKITTSDPKWVFLQNDTVQITTSAPVNFPAKSNFLATFPAPAEFSGELSGEVQFSGELFRHRRNSGRLSGAGDFSGEGILCIKFNVRVHLSSKKIEWT